MKISTYFTDVEWFVAFRKHIETPIDNQKPFKVRILKNTWRYWCADPFVFEKNKLIYIFMEVYDKIKRRGLIGYRTIDEDGNVSGVTPCLDNGKHMSYPFLYEKNGTVYMMPECYQSNCLTVYRAKVFPDVWVEDHVILKDKKVCDSNLIEVNGKSYLATMEIHGMPYQYDRLSLYYLDNEKWKLFRKDPIVLGTDCARNGGACFWHNGKLIRPAQNCSNSYGENLSFQTIDEISKDSYMEKTIGHLFATDVVVTNKKMRFDGIHTFNTNGKIDVIDLRVSCSFQPAYFLGLLLDKLFGVRGNKL